jgi:hypothetical protein
MAVSVTVPVSTEVIEQNLDSKITGAYEDGRLVITLDTRNQNHHQRLGLGYKVKLHFGQTREYEAQELSGLSWPIVYRVIVQDGYYVDPHGQRVHFTTEARGLDSRRGVSLVVMRAAIFLLVVAGVGFRKGAFLLSHLFHVTLSKSALQRWVEEIAGELPDGDEMIRLLDEQKPIREAHFDELFPKGRDVCVLVVKDEHGRIVVTQEVDKRDETSVKPLLERLKTLGLKIETFYIDGYKSYYNAIVSVFGKAVQIQYDYFHIIQNAWRTLWKWAVAHRRDIKARSEQVQTPWYKKKLETLATSLWKNRYILFKADKRLSEEEKERLTQIVEADEKVGTLRAFLGGIWHIFEDSQDEQEARAALEQLKHQPVDRQKSEPFQKVITFLEDHFDWMTTFLQKEGVQRNSLAETGMRSLRRLEIAHDGFRSEKGRDNFLRIYQAVKYLGWTVHHPPSNLGNTG